MKVVQKTKNTETTRTGRGNRWVRASVLLVILSIMVMMIITAMGSGFVSAEGSSAEVYLSLSRSVLNIGKTFTMTLKIKPNTTLPITSFDATLKYDTSKFDIITESGAAKITRPSGMPSGFNLSASSNKGEIIVIGSDESIAQNASVTAKSDTSLAIFTFRVKDNAALGTASFTISDCTVNQMVSSVPTPVSLSVTSTKTAPVATRLETNAYLKALTVDTGTLTPAFSRSVTRYSVDVPMECTSITVTPSKESANSKISITGGSSLNYGTNTIKITVTAQDPDVVKVYTITVTRPSPEVTPTEITPTPTLEITETPSPEPTEITPEVTVTPVPTQSPEDPLQASVRYWKSVAYIFAGLFALTLLTLIIFIVDKVINHGKTVKIRRR